VKTADVDLAMARARQEVLSAQQALDSLTASADLSLAQAELNVLDTQDALDDAQNAFDANNSQENQLQLDATTASLALAEDALARIEEGDGVDVDLLAAAQTRLESAQASLASAEALAAAHQLVASINGTVIDLAIQPGQLITSGAPALVVADLSQWVVKTDNLNEMQVSDLKVGQQVEVVLDALPDLTLTGQITHISSKYEEKRGDITFTVTILLNKVDPHMRWGMTAAVYFKP
jgi:HlyD family secretion protein